MRVGKRVRSQGRVAPLLAMLVACGGRGTEGKVPHREVVASVASVSRSLPSLPALVSAEPQAGPAPQRPEDTGANVPVGLTVESVLEGAEGAWPVGDVVVAQTLDSTGAGGMQRELFLLDGRSSSPLRKLSHVLGLDQFTRVERAFGTWPAQVWLEVHADLISSKRVELHRLDAKRGVAKLAGQLVGSMQTRVASAELADGWLFVIHDPLAGGYRFAGASPLPSLPPLPTVGPDCRVPFAVCGLRRADSGGFELLAVRCEETPVTVYWSDRRARPSEHALPGSQPFFCDQHPDLRPARVDPELGLDSGRLSSGNALPGYVSTPAGPLEAKVDQAFVVAGRTWLVAGGVLYQERAASDGPAQPLGAAAVGGPSAPARAPTPPSSGE